MNLVEIRIGTWLRFGAMAVFVAAPAAAQDPVPNLPVNHRVLNAQEFVQAGAAFGGWVGMGKSQGTLDQGDDVFICATAEAIATPASGNPVEGTGAGYLFVGDALPMTPTDQFKPTDEQIDATLGGGFPDEPIGLGLNDTDFGNVRGAGFPDLLFVPAAHVDRGDLVVGAVNVWNTTSLDPTPVFRILEPPLDGYCAVGGGNPPPDCPVTPAGRFGHSCAIADVDGDGFNDLVVGASASTEPADATCTTRVAHGRVYIFFGHPDFFAAHFPSIEDPPGYLYRCVAIRAPQTVSSLPSAQQFVPGGVFGLSVDAADLDDDGMAEVLVGRCEAEGGNLDRGRAHLFRGSWIADQLPTGGLWCATGRALVLTPPPTTNKDVGVSYAYQTLVDAIDSTPSAFGATVFMLRGDAGFPGTVDNEKPDIAIFSNNTRTPPLYAPTGALTIYFNKSGFVQDPCPDGILVCSDGVKLVTPLSAGGPKAYNRFGFQAKVINWASTQNGSPTLADYLLVSEPQWKDTVTSRANAGRVFMFPLPITSSAAGGNLSPWHTLVDPKGTQTEGLYGHGLDVGNYAVVGFPGQEFVVSSRNRDVEWPEGTGPLYVGAGQAYSYRAGP